MLDKHYLTPLFAPSSIAVLAGRADAPETLTPAGASFQHPLSGVPSSEAKHAPESNRGQQSQSMDPSLPHSAAVSQSPISA